MATTRTSSPARKTRPAAGQTAPAEVAEPAAPATELRVYLRIDGLQRQFAATMATPTRARGYPPKAGDHSLIVEVAPALAIQRVTDSALKATPEVEPGLLYVERQYGILEVHSPDADVVERAGAAILAALDASPEDQLKPKILYSDIIEEIGDQHAVILNRTRDASMLLPGSALLVYEMAPALFAAVAANSAERVAPDLTLVDVQMIGAAGRLFIAGDLASVTVARDEITRVLQEVVGR
ncbi:microcompartment protein [Gordonia sp. PP30]|uniref:microcompartment protein n=1 Tax=Gordonia sp. PP30 TaxID=2935861 RepID=UPI001FFE5162|nr:microcompartment protein [Gordonia sp. PP30]UQE74942.1 microcompartment protein [Gordonia sp. PP30]